MNKTSIEHRRKATGMEDRMERDEAERQAIPVACDHHRVEGFQKECVWCRGVKKKSTSNTWPQTQADSSSK